MQFYAIFFLLTAICFCKIYSIPGRPGRAINFFISYFAKLWIFMQNLCISAHSTRAHKKYEFQVTHLEGWDVLYSSFECYIANVISYIANESMLYNNDYIASAMYVVI